MKKFLLVSIISLTLISPLGVSAYYESAGPTNLYANIYPSNPSISQKTNITLGSYLADLDACDITWTQDGQPAGQGIGEKSLSFVTGQIGQTVSISVNLNCPNQNKMVKNWLFQTNDVEFLISADTYTPPFYKGNSRVSPNSRVKIIALPQVFNTVGELTKTENLIYTWTKGGKAMPISSGYGKNSITIQANELTGLTNFAVEISSLTGEIKVTKAITLTTENPQIIFYENKPLLGLQYQQGQSSSLILDKNETTLTAEPFFFPNSDIASGNLTFSWSMNDKSIGSSPDGRSVTLRQNAGQTGEALIKLQINNQGNTFSSAKKELNINFGQKSSLFGF